MTLTEATALVRSRLFAKDHKEYWEAGPCDNVIPYNWWCEKCTWTPVWPEQFHAHDIPCPPTDAALGFAVLRELGTQMGGFFALVHCDPSKATNKPWVLDRAGCEMTEYTADPLEAAILAAAEFVAKEKL